VLPILGVSFVFMLATALGSGSASAQTEPRGAAPPSPASVPPALQRLIPGEQFLPPALQAQQADDFDNPAYPFVEAGEMAWSRVEGAAGKSCQDCHGKGAQNSVKRAAASYPKFAPDFNQVITLQSRVNRCRVGSMRAPPWQDSSSEMMATVAYLRWLARGSLPAIDSGGPSKTVFERGFALFQAKIGLLQLSCAQCHDQRFGQKFGADTLSQGHPLAYPVFSIGKGRIISLHERFRMCNQLTRSEVQPENAPDYVALELYLTWRGKDLPITAPGVRP
jgi:L-cysteine S-thiosulfotransferase